MSKEFSYTNARQNLAKLMDAATKDREVVVIKRRGAEDVALVAADELRSLEETAHLLRSPENARRLLSALEDALAGKGEPTTIEELRRTVGLDEDE
jgi:antitoxin YefM